MNRAWCKSIQLQLALWTEPYTDAHQAQTNGEDDVLPASDRDQRERQPKGYTSHEVTAARVGRT
jgi:hypothetical protein